MNPRPDILMAPALVTIPLTASNNKPLPGPGAGDQALLIHAPANAGAVHVDPLPILRLPLMRASPAVTVASADALVPAVVAGKVKTPETVRAAAVVVPAMLALVPLTFRLPSTVSAVAAPAMLKFPDTNGLPVKLKVPALMLKFPAIDGLPVQVELPDVTERFVTDQAPLSRKELPIVKLPTERLPNTLLTSN